MARHELWGSVCFRSVCLLRPFDDVKGQDALVGGHGAGAWAATPGHCVKVTGAQPGTGTTQGPQMTGRADVQGGCAGQGRSLLQVQECFCHSEQQG